jgi:hypothetical protein
VDQRKACRSDGSHCPCRALDHEAEYVVKTNFDFDFHTAASPLTTLAAGRASWPDFVVGQFPYTTQYAQPTYFEKHKRLEVSVAAVKKGWFGSREAIVGKAEVTLLDIACGPPWFEVTLIDGTMARGTLRFRASMVHRPESVIAISKLQVQNLPKALDGSETLRVVVAESAKAAEERGSPGRQTEHYVSETKIPEAHVGRNDINIMFMERLARGPGLTMQEIEDAELSVVLVESRTPVAWVTLPLAQFCKPLSPGRPVTATSTFFPQAFGRATFSAQVTYSNPPQFWQLQGGVRRDTTVTQAVPSRWHAVLPPASAIKCTIHWERSPGSAQSADPPPPTTPAAVAFPPRPAGSGAALASSGAAIAVGLLGSLGLPAAAAPLPDHWEAVAGRSGEVRFRNRVTGDVEESLPTVREYDIHFVAPAGTKLGITFAPCGPFGTAEDRAARVQAIAPGSYAAGVGVPDTFRAGVAMCRVGHVLVAINRASVRGWNFESVVRALQAAGSPVLLSFSNPFAVSAEGASASRLLTAGRTIVARVSSTVTEDQLDKIPRRCHHVFLGEFSADPTHPDRGWRRAGDHRTSFYVHDETKSFSLVWPPMPGV